MARSSSGAGAIRTVNFSGARVETAIPLKPLLEVPTYLPIHRVLVLELAISHRASHHDHHTVCGGGSLEAAGHDMGSSKVSNLPHYVAAARHRHCPKRQGGPGGSRMVQVR